jgi:hypothetical protein
MKQSNEKIVPHDCRSGPARSIRDDCRMRTVLTSAAGALTALVLLAGCGGARDEASVPGGADPGDVRVIDGWARALAAGDIEKAVTYWAIPSAASNGTPKLAFGSTREILDFNQDLPCGAELIEAETDDESGLTTATFNLVERPGPGGGCGEGVGFQARTVFRIEDGKITLWERAPDPPGRQQAPAAPEDIT